MQITTKKRNSSPANGSKLVDADASVASVPLVNQEEQAVDAKQNLTLYHLVLFQGGYDELNRAVVRDISSELDELITTPPEQTAIDIWLDSPGGDAHAAYKLFLNLRARCSTLRAVVPDYAKSAATLLLLGVDSIYMAASAELGPLDVQIEHPDREGTRISGLDAANSLTHLGTTAIDLVLSGGASIVRYTQLSRHEVLRETLRFTARFLQPAVAKLDPQLVHQATQQLQVAEHYALHMLRCRNIPNEQQMSLSDARGFMRHLTSHYPAHGYIISREEAEHLGLPIEIGETYPRWEYVKKMYTNFEASEESFVLAFTDASLDKKERSEPQSLIPDEGENASSSEENHDEKN